MKKVGDIAIPRTLDEACDPARLALLVYDMQVGVISQIKDGARIVERVGHALEAARSAGVRVAFARHISLPKSWMGATQYRTAMAWQRLDEPNDVKPWFLPDNPAIEIVPELRPRADEFVFDKLTTSAFASTPLAFALRDCGVDSLAIAGVAMEIGIEPTVRDAPDYGTVAIVIEDACGAGNVTAGKRSIDTLRFIGEAIICNIADFSATLGCKPPRNRTG